MTKDNPKTELEARIKEFKSGWRRSKLDLSGLSLKTEHLEVARSDFTGLAKVKSLYLGANIASRAKLRSTNSLTTVPAWLFGSFPNLEILDLSDNELQSLPDTISTCIRLHTLKLSGNAFAQFPLTVCAIPTLYTLNLEGPGNTFGSLPEDICALRALADLKVNKTAVKWPPLDIIEKGAQRTTGFVRDVVVNGGQVINEAKVILVGPGDHGKTTLRLWLTEGRFMERASTRGGEIGELRVQATRADTGKSGRIRLWDFGGQEQYRAAQRSLFSADALFVLVCRARGKIEEAGVPEWLQLIEHVNRHATVFLVFSHMDHVDRAPTLEHLPPRLRALIPNDNVFELDATRPDGGIEKIRQRIVETCRKMDAFGHRWPVSELRLRGAVDGLRQTGRKVISKEQFRLLCDQHGVESDRVDGVAQSIGNIDVGPHAKIVVTDPEWILKAISYVHDDKTVRERNGVLLRSDFDRIWVNHKCKDDQKPLQFSEQYWDDILAVMTHQGLAYRLGDREWLVPECVTGTRPGNIDWTADSATGPRRTIQSRHRSTGLHR